MGRVSTLGAMVFIVILLNGCANNQKVMSGIYSGIDREAVSSLAGQLGFYNVTSAIYKGYSLIKINKMGALPVHVVFNPSGELISMEGFNSGTDFDRDYLRKVVNHTFKVEVSLTIKADYSGGARL